jgi:hypothetical protein
MNEPSIWDDPELQTGDNFFSFDNVGDTLQGRIELIKRQIWADGSVSPQLFLTAPDGTDVILSAGQIRLKNELVAQRPAPGDDIWIRMTKVEPRGGGKTLKHFEVRVRRNNIVGYQSQFGKHGAAQQQAAAGWQGQQPAAGYGQQQPAAQPGPQYGYQQPPAAGPGPFQQGAAPAQQPGPQPPAQPVADDPWAAPGQQQLPADDPWATGPAQQQQPAAGQPPF